MGMTNNRVVKGSQDLTLGINGLQSATLFPLFLSLISWKVKGSQANAEKPCWTHDLKFREDD